MIIKSITHDMTDQVTKFMLTIIKEDFGYDFNPVWHQDIVNFDELYLEQDGSCAYACFDGDRIVGTIVARRYDKEYPEFRERYNKVSTLSIWRHYIDKEYRRRGIGKQLLAMVDNFARDNDYTYLYLHTQRSIPGSLEYWLAQGFVISYDTHDMLDTVHLEKIL